MKKHTIGWIVLFIYCLLVLPVYADSTNGIGATSGTCGSRLTWELSDDGTLTITGTGAMSNYDYSIGPPWEAKKGFIKSIVINEGATTIGDYAFDGCDNLTSISFPNSMRTIGDYAFHECYRLKSVILNEGMTGIGSYAFGYCVELTSITFPESLETINSCAFIRCDALSEITLPGNVAQMGWYAFGECGYLTEVTLPAVITTIPDYGFTSCNLEELIIPEGTVSIGSSAFSWNAGLSIVHIPSTLENISAGAFNGCSSLTDVYYSGTQAEAEAIQIGTENNYLSTATWHFTSEPTPPPTPIPEPSFDTMTLPSNLTTIESEAFAGVSAKVIIIPDTVETIESLAFANNPNLEVLYFEGSPYSIAADMLSGSNGVTVSVIRGSYAENWAKARGLDIEYHE